ncbi:MAG TPA: MEDS domain-containing protein [Vicinamibacterales bacterium]|nr:MEDS domain-containing protein [Vicinamibacterales bacterium]
MTLKAKTEHFHAVQFYKDARSLAERVAAFIADGLDVGHPVLAVAGHEHAAGISRALEASGVDVADVKKTGELQILDARKVLTSFMVGDRPDPLLFRSNVGDVIERMCAGRLPYPIRVYGEMVDLLWQDGNPDGAIRLEILWNQLASAYDFELLCGYAMGHFYKETRDARYEEVCQQHSHVIQPA